MIIAMFTNTYLPHVGGVANSVASFANEYRRRGHRTLIVAPKFDRQPEHENDVVRVAAIQHFNGSDFSVALADFGTIDQAIDALKPDIVHSHHPFLLGNSAVRAARARKLPLVFTHHTMYEQYTHYVPADSPALKRFVVELATQYANLCDHVVAPSESIAAVLRGRGVTTSVSTIPTGVDVGAFADITGSELRKELGIPGDTFVVGHVGRLAPEKNLAFLAEAVSVFLDRARDAHFLVVGEGPAERELADRFAKQGQHDRLHCVGTLRHPRLAQAYRAMNVFAFASKSETQGMVLTEAMAAGVPVVAIDASGAREVVVDGQNGRLLLTETVHAFRDALEWVARLTPAERDAMGRECLKTAQEFSMERSADKALALYGRYIGQPYERKPAPEELWTAIAQKIDTERLIASGVAKALGAAVRRADQSPGSVS